MHCAAMRKRFGMRGCELTAEQMQLIQIRVRDARPKTAWTGWWAEMAHKFATDHLIAKLKQAHESLSRGEEKLVRACFGRVRYNAPPREHERKARAARELRALGGRGQTIFDGLKTEIKKFDEANPQLQVSGTSDNPTDIFSNALSHYFSQFVHKKSFGETANYLDEMKKFAEESQASPYE